jgi:hypothetical protein
MFVCRYIGEVITEAEAERRGEEYDRKVLDALHCMACKILILGNYVSLRFGLFSKRARPRIRCWLSGT